MSRRSYGRSQHKSRKGRGLAGNITIIVFSVLFLIVGAVFVYVDRMILDPITSISPSSSDPESVSEQESSLPPSPSGTEQSVDPNEPVLEDGPTFSGLYHDPAVMNILVVGVENYQANDVGRSDSMILVSIDTRHEKIKMTSIMRDLFVRVPGYGSMKINGAFSLGGSALSVQTIESNFGVDIDRWVEVDMDAFRHLIDKMGGVEITVTDAEADLINQNSGEDSSKYLPGAGTYTLTGRQANYYARIRAIGDDFERTQRQRNVMESVIEQFRDADLMTINDMIIAAVPEVKTNISKSELLKLAMNSLMYLKYPIEQARVPFDDAYENARSPSAGAVLVPDLYRNSEEMVAFIYEDDIPEI